MKLYSTCILALALAAQPQFKAPVIGHIEYYGVRKLSPQRLSRAIGWKTGDPLPPSRSDVEDKLEGIPGVVQSRVEAVCCQDDGSAVVFVGIEEKGAAHFAFRSPPAGDAALPPEASDRYQRMLAAVADAARRGSTAEDLTQGHALAADPDARALQQSFVGYAKENLDLLRNVLRNSADPEQRVMAAAIMGYAPDKTKVVADLEYALQDPDESVRAVSLRSLTAIGVLSAREPVLGIRIPPTWLVEMLNSIVLGDRVKAASALVSLTEKDGGNALAQIRERALGSVLEMAQWKTLRYALPAYILLGRMAGMTEQGIQETWSKGDRTAVLLRFAGKR